MQFSSEVTWTISDFVIAGTLLLGTGLTYTIIIRKSGEMMYRFAIAFVLFTGLFLVWVNMAVGIIGSEKNDINILYTLVIFARIIGGFIFNSAPKE